MVGGPVSHLYKVQMSRLQRFVVRLTVRLPLANILLLLVYGYCR